MIMSSIVIRDNILLRLLSLLISFLVIHKMLGFIGHLPTFYYGALLVCASLVLVFSGPPRFNTLVLFFVIYIGFCLLILNPPAIFSPWLRYGLFVSIMTIASPLLQSKKFRFVRRACLMNILYASVIISVLSFFCYFLGVNFMTYTADIEYSDRGGLFSGLTNHSIVLGITSGIAICLLTYKGLTQNWKWFILAIPCIGSLLFSASRGALAATIMGITIIMMMTHRRRMSKTKIWLIILITIVGIGYVVNNTDALSGIKSKMLDRDSASLLSSREDKIAYRMEEFKSSPIIGIGFSTVSIQGGDEYDKVTGTIEPGSSWLSLLSMTGIIGSLLFMLIYIKCCKTQVANKSSISILLLGLLTFFAFSMLSEGYVFAAGSPLCFLLWLILGCCIDYNQ